MSDNELVLILAAIQVIALTAGCGALVFVLRRGDQDEHDGGQDDDGGSDRRPRPSRPSGGGPPGGPPLPDSVPAPVRLREPWPLADHRLPPARRAPREPHRPRVPSSWRTASPAPTAARCTGRR